MWNGLSWSVIEIEALAQAVSEEKEEEFLLQEFVSCLLTIS